MKRMLVIACALLTAVCLFVSAQGTVVGADKQSMYEKALLYEELGMYSEALELFKELGSFSDARSHRYYCSGMTNIESANELESTGYLSDALSYIENAERDFDRLAKIEFADSDLMLLYCQARAYELKGMYQTAIDLYYEYLSGVSDSDDRLDMLLDHSAPRPTQVPVEKLPERLYPIRAKATQVLDVYFGPGRDYTELKHRTMTVSEENEIYILGICGEFYLIEFETDEGLMRVWTSTLRVTRTDESREPVKVHVAADNGYINQDTQALYGPGDEYAVSDITLPAASRVKVYEKEGKYAMVEVEGRDGKSAVCVWVPVSSLN
ncbi:MAG: hypothetical protein IKR85_02400 [Clostridia bacterium]|nr:hypothetical protein [Clostridia bacterium]